MVPGHPLNFKMLCRHSALRDKGGHTPFVSGRFSSECGFPVALRRASSLFHMMTEAPQSDGLWVIH